MATVQFGVLGPLEAHVDGRFVPLGGPKPRLLLATLLLSPNTAVPTDVLVDVLWPDRPPRSAAANVRTYVHSLRRLLDNRIEHRPGGYLLRVDRDELDLSRFEATGDVALWRGRFLADLPPSHAFAATSARVTELWLSAHEQRLAARIDRGEHEPAAAELRGLLSDHPLREQLWGLLITALTAAGRRTEARRAYTEAEQVLRDELNTAPGPALRAALAPAPVCQLPLDLPDFTGRGALVGELVAKLCGRDAPTVVVLSGPPGVGKSSVAVRVAHAVRAEFPDGQLHIDLAGTSASPRQADRRAARAATGGRPRGHPALAPGTGRAPAVGAGRPADVRRARRRRVRRAGRAAAAGRRWAARCS